MSEVGEGEVLREGTCYTHTHTHTHTHHRVMSGSDSRHAALAKQKAQRSATLSHHHPDRDGDEQFLHASHHPCRLFYFCIPHLLSRAPTSLAVFDLFPPSSFIRLKRAGSIKASVPLLAGSISWNGVFLFATKAHGLDYLERLCGFSVCLAIILTTILTVNSFSSS